MCHPKEITLTNKNNLHRNFLNDKLLMKDTRGAFLTKIDPFLNVLRAQEECTDNNNNNKDTLSICFSFYNLQCIPKYGRDCRTYIQSGDCRTY